VHVESSKGDLITFRHLTAEIEDMASLFIMPRCRIKGIKLSAFTSGEESFPTLAQTSESQAVYQELLIALNRVKSRVGSAPL